MKTTGAVVTGVETDDAALRDPIDTLHLDLRESEERYRTLFDLVQRTRNLYCQRRSAAVDAAAEFQPDVVFMDIGLPVLKAMKPLGKFVSCNATKNRYRGLDRVEPGRDRCRSESAGFDAHLVEPVDHGALGKLLVELRNRNAA